MKKTLSIALALMLLLTACGGNEVESSSEAESSSSSSSSSSSASSDASSEAQDTPSSSSSETTSPVNQNPSTDTIAPFVKFADDKYHLTTPATKSWKKAYDTFYQSYRPNIKHVEADLSKGYEVRDNLYYMQFSLDGNGALGIADIANFPTLIEAATENPAIIMDRYVSEGVLFAVMQDVKTKAYAGEGAFELQLNTSEALLTSLVSHKEGEYAYRTSMTITEGIENQLLSAGFKPETTEAYALDIPLATYGIFFIDGKNAAFFPNGNSHSWSLPYGVLYTLEDLGCAMSSTEVDPATSSPAVLENPATGKPVIYLYPERATDVNVKVSYPQDFSYTYPQYSKKYGWQVTAHPDGRLVDSASNEYYYLFWEGDAKLDWDMSKGFVVDSLDTEAFLEEKLTYLGLNARERNDFITYWAPEMRQNPYNLVSFSTKQYDDLAKLTVTPSPNTTIRVHMLYKPCQKSAKVEPQVLTKAPKRSGFTVVEWGGTRAHY